MGSGPQTKTKTKCQERVCVPVNDTYGPDSGSFHWGEHMTVLSFGNSCCAFTNAKNMSYVQEFFSPSPAPCLVSGFLLQAHGSGRPEELNFLAESERRRYSDCRAGLRHVQSTSQTAVIRQHETAASPFCPPVDSALPSYLKD